MRDSSRTTVWQCDKCSANETLQGDYQELPPEGWRIVHVLPVFLDLALEGVPHRAVALCAECFTWLPE